MLAYAVSYGVRITLDTNVLYQALRSSRGASHEILQLVRRGKVQMAISVAAYAEYRDVLHRADTRRETRLSTDDMDRVLDFLALVGIATPIDFLWRPNLRDEADNLFVELAVASGSEYLITRNTRDYSVDAQLMFDSFRVVNPREFLSEWRSRRE